MKKFVASFIACVALVQSAYALTPPLSESLAEYGAIIEAISEKPEFRELFSPREFIVDVKRKTEEIDVLGTVRYRILTRTVGDTCEDNRYIATLLVEPNPGIGPKIVTVIRIVKRTLEGQEDMISNEG